MRPWLYAALGWTVLIAALCWTPRGVVEKAGNESDLFKIPNFDKLIHTGLFVGFAFLWLKASPPPRRFTPVVVGGFVWTIVTELGQLSPWVNRDARFDDGAFDMLGVLIGGLVFYWLERQRARTGVQATPAGLDA